MSRILHSILIGILAFFGFLGVFALAGLGEEIGGPDDGRGGTGGRGTGDPTDRGTRGPRPTSSDGPTTGPATDGPIDPGTPGAPRLVEVLASWGEAGALGSEVRLALVVRNPGPADTVASIAYTAQVNGVTVAEGRAGAGERVANGDSVVPLTFDLAPNFPSGWLESHVAAGEASRLLVQGELTLATGSVLPFEWASSWQSAVPAYFAALADCPQQRAPVCLHSGSAAWSASGSLGLDATVQVHNQAATAVWVRSGTLTLLWDGIAVAQGSVDGARIEPGETVALAATLRFDQAQVTPWWSRHVERCEATPMRLQLDLGLADGTGWDIGTVSWTTAEGTFQTAFLCPPEGA